MVLTDMTRIVLVIIWLDQVTKYCTISFLKEKPGMLYKVFPILDIVHTWNYGISFGMLSDYYQYSNKVFLLVNTIIVAFLMYQYKRLTNKLEIIGFTLIIGGAIGNLVDRMVHGAVFDFIHFHYKSYYFPAFNMADVFISLGVIIYAAQIVNSNIANSQKP